jgi:hypothetical protein
MLTSFSFQAQTRRFQLRSIDPGQAMCGRYTLRSRRKRKVLPQIDRGKSAEPVPFDCRRIVYRGAGRLITMEK